LPATTRTLVVEGEDVAGVVHALLRSQLQPSALDVLHPGRVAVLFEGSPRAVDAQLARATALVGGADAGEAVWHESRERPRSAPRRVHFAPGALTESLPWLDEAVIRPGAGVAYGLARIPDDDTRPGVRRLVEAIREQLDPRGVFA